MALGLGGSPGDDRAASLAALSSGAPVLRSVLSSLTAMLCIFSKSLIVYCRRAIAKPLPSCGQKQQSGGFLLHGLMLLLGIGLFAPFLNTNCLTILPNSPLTSVAYLDLLLRISFNQLLYANEDSALSPFQTLYFLFPFLFLFL